jgi:hypothetical protein
MKWLAASLFTMALSALLSVACASPPTPVYAFINGRWWNGSEYVSKPMYVVAGELRDSKPLRLDETIDLHNQFVIPPLAEGHNHWLEADQVDAYNACYLSDGVYYVKDMANVPYVVDRIRDKVNLPTSVDFVTALQGFTGPDSHPIEILDYFVKAGILPSTWKSPYDPEAEFVVRTQSDVDQHFKLLLSENPSFVKVFLLYSEEYAQRLSDPKRYGNYRGIDPSLVPHIVELAHAAHLKVMAHVYSVPDFRAALSAGADAIEHLPGMTYEPELSMDHFKLTAADAAEAKRRGVTLTPTIYGLADLPEDNPKYASLIHDQIAIPNLKLLKDAGVPMLLGSDHFRFSPLSELFVMRDTGVFTNRELLDIATHRTAVDIFPNRKIGGLAAGYEANFLVLAKDPLENLDNLRSITLRVKQGRRLTLPASALTRKSLACIE